MSFLLSACGSQPESAAPTSTSSPATATNITPMETQTAIPIPETSAPPQDPTLFGAIGINEIQAFALEPVANAIFVKIMDGFIASGNILEYQVVRVTIFPGSGGLLSEITFNLRTTDPVWLTDGGTPAAEDWINNKCYHFDFVTTEIEYQLKNRRTCN